MRLNRLTVTGRAYTPLEGCGGMLLIKCNNNPKMRMKLLCCSKPIQHCWCAFRRLGENKTGCAPHQRLKSNIYIYILMEYCCLSKPSHNNYSGYLFVCSLKDNDTTWMSSVEAKDAKWAASDSCPILLPHCGVLLWVIFLLPHFGLNLTLDLNGEWQ